MLDVILCRRDTEATPKTYMEQLFTNTNMNFVFCNLSGGSDTEVAAIIFRCKGDSLGALKIWGGGGGGVKSGRGIIIIIMVVHA